MRITIKDIAKYANVSTATVSNFLNGKTIKADNKEKIEEAIEKFDYSPNVMARNMRAKKKNTICIFLSKAGDYFWGNLYSAIEQYFRKNNYTTIIVPFESKELSKESLRIIRGKQIDGAVIVASNSYNDALPRLLEESDIPYALADQKIFGIKSDMVGTDNFSAGFLAAKYLIEKGHKKIYAIGRCFDSLETMQERRRGVLSACMKYDIKDVTVIDEKRDNIDFYFKNISSHVAILSFGYDITIRTISYIQNYFYKIGEDISLISFDDDEIFSALSPMLTVVLQDIEQVGEKVAQTLIKRINKDFSGFPMKIELQAQIIERESVKELK